MPARRLRFGHGFRVVLGNRRAQAAQMVLAPCESEGGPGNAHRGADQWLYVVAGRGVARVGSRRHPIAPGTLLLIERGATQQIRCTGRGRLVTLDVYVPPAYDAAGEPLPRGRPRPTTGARARR
jgi:mannose-6-phosphate isomerase-like protein (cupin superfamily)